MGKMECWIVYCEGRRRRKNKIKKDYTYSMLRGVELAPTYKKHKE